MRICLVEGHEVLRSHLVDFLTDASMEVIAAVGTAHAGLHAVVSERPDVAVVGSRLPDGSGLDLCRLIAVAVPDVVLLLHSGIVTPQDESDALDAGVAEVVPKSIRGEGLLNAINRYRPV